MSHLQEVPLDEETFEPFAGARRDFGFVPNFYKAQTLRPDIIEAETRLVHAIVIKEGALTRRQKEYIFLVCSAANLSTYCVTAHCEIIRILGLEGPAVEAIALNHLATDLSIPDKMLLTFALKLNNETLRFGEEDVARLRPYGFGDQAILEAMLMVSLAKWANLLSHGLGAHPDFPVPQGMGLPGAGDGARAA